MKPPRQRRSNKNAAQLASSGNASWNSVSDRALAIDCPAMATTGGSSAAKYQI